MGGPGWPVIGICEGAAMFDGALDADQRRVAERLTRLAADLRRRGLVRGVYVWGPVGRGGPGSRPSCSTPSAAGSVDCTSTSSFATSTPATRAIGTSAGGRSRRRRGDRQLPSALLRRVPLARPRRCDARRRRVQGAGRSRDRVADDVEAEPWPDLVSAAVPIDLARTASRLALL
ncbi:hypothetical protein [Alloactinosynnema sp. L-07]|nr:hypothetical protein [Alloactinosynnema sp. L-07]